MSIFDALLTEVLCNAGYDIGGLWYSAGEACSILNDSHVIVENESEALSTCVMKVRRWPIEDSGMDGGI